MTTTIPAPRTPPPSCARHAPLSCRLAGYLHAWLRRARRRPLRIQAGPAIAAALHAITGRPRDLPIPATTLTRHLATLRADSRFRLTGGRGRGVLTLIELANTPPPKSSHSPAKKCPLPSILRDSVKRIDKISNTGRGPAAPFSPISRGARQSSPPPLHHRHAALTRLSYHLARDVYRRTAYDNAKTQAFTPHRLAPVLAEALRAGIPRQRILGVALDQIQTEHMVATDRQLREGRLPSTTRWQPTGFVHHLRRRLGLAPSDPDSRMPQGRTDTALGGRVAGQGIPTPPPYPYLPAESREIGRGEARPHGQVSPHPLHADPPSECPRWGRSTVVYY